MLRFLALPAAMVVVGACDEGSTEPEPTIRFAEADLMEGVEAMLDENLATLALPFEAPLPDDVVDFDAQMQRAVSLFITAESSGLTLDLAAGTRVAGTPAAAGEYAWAPSEARDAAVLTLFNGDPQPWLSVDETHRGQLAVTSNEVVARLPAVSFPITVIGG